MSYLKIILSLFFVISGSQALALSGKSSSGNFSNNYGNRSYELYAPSGLSKNSGLLVVLHGCFQTGGQMASGGEFNSYADERGFAVLYPEQSYMDNVWKCWNWFKPENQSRDGELSIIAGMTQKIIADYKLNSKKVFIAGFSAGAAMASNALACYSDLYSGGLIHSGLEYAAAQTEGDAHDVMGTGPDHDLDKVADAALKCSPGRKNLLPVIVVHGQSDSAVAPINADRIATLFEKMNTSIFKSQNGEDSRIDHKKSEIVQDGYKYSADVFDTTYDSKVVVRKIMVQGMSHTWSGGQPTAPYMEPRGVKATQIMVDAFFPAN